jgi:ubiquinol-cytochrome c reductase cytochrome b subunit
MAGMRERSIDAGFKAYQWLEHRLGSIKPLNDAATHHTPSNSASWLYVFGSAATVLLVMQVMTGILLALVYSPPQMRLGAASSSSTTISHWAGICGRCMGGFRFHGCHCAYPHGAGLPFRGVQVPRELTWIIGVILLLLTLGMAFTGQVLRFDQDA